MPSPPDPLIPKFVPDDRLTFPPFPTPPPGVTITPFKNFKEIGIQMFAKDGDDVERDGLGIPTIALRVRHDADVCKTETKRKKPAKVDSKAASSIPGAKLEWWEEWMDTEDQRLSGPYNPYVPHLPNLHRAWLDIHGAFLVRLLLSTDFMKPPPISGRADLGLEVSSGSQQTGTR